MADRPEEVGVYVVKKIQCVIIPEAPEIIGELIQLFEVFWVSGIYENILKSHTFDSLIRFLAKFYAFLTTECA
jgi:hypothetical protein